MRANRINPSRFVISTSLLGLLISNAYALTLSEVELQSYVGQPFKAAIAYKLNAGETLTPECLSLSLPNNDLPSLGRASISLSVRNEQHGILYVTSEHAIGEPTVGFGVQINCNHLQLSRTYTAFLNIAPANEVKAPSNKELPSFTPKTADLPNRDPQLLTPKQPTTLAEIAKKYYPAHTPQYPRYLNKLISVNPDYTAETAIAAGTPISIPDRLRSTKKAPPPTPRLESGLLRLDGEPLAAKKPKPIEPNSPEYTRALEQKVAELNEIQQKMQLEISQLNLRLSQLNNLDANLPASAPLAQASTVSQVASEIAPKVITAPASAAITAAPVASDVITAHPDDRNISLWAGAIAAIAASLLGGWYVLRRRQTQNWQEEDLTQLQSRIAPSYDAPQTRFPHATQNTMMSMLHLGGSGTPQGIEVDEFVGNEMGRAQMLIAQGETMQAIDVLYHCIDEDPEDIERWLMLFRLFRQQGMKSEYANLAQSLKIIAHDEADWELVRNIGAKFDPENPLYARTPAPLYPPTPKSKSLEINLAAAGEPEIEMDLAPPLSPEASMLEMMSQASPIPPQYSALLKPETVEMDYAIELPSLDLPADPAGTEDAIASFEIEELDLSALDEQSDNSIDFTPLDSAETDVKKPNA
ncbi:hypothetical protein HQ393_13835 [Chitinibacter bivalviorum]|uniref:FimV N-terminal domain-containing protein n=1 Tax=Chitinibacter bivalviorum TaxID=2739434 RepID=A0A7H9BPF7_9NEIS|nr:hypothetical protein [Chitinibacter bivalviorum]QLG89234.1 hypothetical protein HQ393_13835 [Chitinibacter bivalviorum]